METGPSPACDALFETKIPFTGCFALVGCAAQPYSWVLGALGSTGSCALPGSGLFS